VYGWGLHRDGEVRILKLLLSDCLHGLSFNSDEEMVSTFLQNICGLHSITSQIKVFTVTAARTTDPTKLLVIEI
jgi:hypothetical protein